MGSGPDCGLGSPCVAVRWIRRVSQPRKFLVPKNKKPQGGRPAKNFDPARSKRGADKITGTDRKPGSHTPAHRGYLPGAAETPRKERWSRDERAAMGPPAHRADRDGVTAVREAGGSHAAGPRSARFDERETRSGYRDVRAAGRGPRAGFADRSALGETRSDVRGEGRDVRGVRGEDREIRGAHIDARPSRGEYRTNSRDPRPGGDRFERGDRPERRGLSGSGRSVQAGRPNFGDRSSYSTNGDRPRFGNRSDRSAGADRPPFGERPRFSDRGERPTRTGRQ